MAPRFSVVIPFYNDGGNIAPLLAKLFATLPSLGGSSEILLVDDGSTDETPREIAEATKDRADCLIIRFATNGGQAASLLAGLRQARGGIILTLDGDGQNDPADLPRLLGMVIAGPADVVCGIRTPRHGSAMRRIMSRIANAVRSRFLRDNLSDAGCQLRAFRREIVAILEPSPLLQAFLPAMAAAAGFRVAELPVRHQSWLRGDSKYGLQNLWLKPALEMIRLRRKLFRKRKLAKQTLHPS